MNIGEVREGELYAEKGGEVGGVEIGEVGEGELNVEKGEV